MNARERILEKLRRATPAQKKPAPDVAGWYARRAMPASDAARIERFCANIELAHAETHRVSAADWPQRVHELLRERGIGRLLVAAGTPHGETALDELPPRGIECSVYDQPIEAWKKQLFEATPASLTAARAAIAETGTLILWPDAREPRLMSLVPPVHIVLLDATKIHDSFFAAMTSERWTDGLPTNALLVSGPSKTADIQQTLAYGAHGPKELIVLLLENTLENTPQNAPEDAA